MPLIKQVHITLAVLSLSGFIIRGIWMLKDSALLQQQWVRITPHIIDTLLLISGISLIFQFHIYPNQNSWLMSKLVALVLYIILGSIALKRGKTKPVRIAAWVMALMVFGYMLSAALSHYPFPFLGR